MARLTVRIKNVPSWEPLTTRETDDLNQLVFRVEDAMFDFHNLFLYLRERFNKSSQKQLIKSDQQFLRKEGLDFYGFEADVTENDLPKKEKSGEQTAEGTQELDVTRFRSITFENDCGEKCDDVIKIPFWKFYDKIQKRRLENILSFINQQYFGPFLSLSAKEISEEQYQAFTKLLNRHFGEPIQMAEFFLFEKPLQFRLSPYKIQMKNFSYRKMLIEIPLFKMPNQPVTQHSIEKILSDIDLLPFSCVTRYNGIWLNYLWDYPSFEHGIENQVLILSQLIGMAQQVYDFFHSTEFQDWFDSEYPIQDATKEPSRSPFSSYSLKELEQISLIHPVSVSTTFEDQWLFWKDQKNRYRMRYYLNRGEFSAAVAIAERQSELSVEVTRELLKHERFVMVEKLYDRIEEIEVRIQLIHQLVIFFANRKDRSEVSRCLKKFIRDARVQQHRPLQITIKPILASIQRIMDAESLFGIYEELTALKRDKMPFIIEAEWLSYFLYHNFQEKHSDILQERITALFMSLSTIENRQQMDKIIELWDVLQTTEWTTLKSTSTNILKKLVSGHDYENYYMEKLKMDGHGIT